MERTKTAVPSAAPRANIGTSSQEWTPYSLTVVARPGSASANSAISSSPDISKGSPLARASVNSDPGPDANGSMSPMGTIASLRAPGATELAARRMGMAPGTGPATGSAPPKTGSSRLT